MPLVGRDRGLARNAGTGHCIPHPEHMNAKIFGRGKGGLGVTASLLVWAEGERRASGQRELTIGARQLVVMSYAHVRAVICSVITDHVRRSSEYSHI
eukprot:1713219-Rhodomonas_salina.1